MRFVSFMENIMKKWLIVLVFALCITLLAGKEYSNITFINKPMEKKYSPLYMEYSGLDNYFINQPLIESIRWTSIFSSFALIFYSMAPSGFYGTYELYHIFAIPHEAPIGWLYGLTKGIIYNYRSNKGLTVRFRKHSFLQEHKVSIHRNNHLFTYKIIFNRPFSFWDETGLSYSLNYDSRHDRDLKLFYALKAHFFITDYFHYNKFILPYYTLNAGYSNRKYSFENKTKWMQTFDGIGQVGIKLNFFDIFYLKLEFEQEYSPFYHYFKNKGHNIKFNTTQGIGCGMGTIFF